MENGSVNIHFTPPYVVVVVKNSIKFNVVEFDRTSRIIGGLFGFTTLHVNEPTSSYLTTNDDNNEPYSKADDVINTCRLKHSLRSLHRATSTTSDLTRRAISGAFHGGADNRYSQSSSAFSATTPRNRSRHSKLLC